MLLGSIADFLALCFAPQSLVTPLGSMTLVANLFFAHFWLVCTTRLSLFYCMTHVHIFGCQGERATGRDIIATITILVGTVLTTFSADHTSTKYNASELIQHFKNPYFIVYIGCLGIGLSVLSVVLFKEVRARTQTSDWSKHSFIPFGYASLSGMKSFAFGICEIEVLEKNRCVWSAISLAR